MINYHRDHVWIGRQKDILVPQLPCFYLHLPWPVFFLSFSQAIVFLFFQLKTVFFFFSSLDTLFLCSNIYYLAFPWLQSVSWKWTNLPHRTDCTGPLFSLASLLLFLFNFLPKMTTLKPQLSSNFRSPNLQPCSYIFAKKIGLKE